MAPISPHWFSARGFQSTMLSPLGSPRVVSSHAYPNRRLTPATAGEMLRRFRQSFPEIHRFWADDFSPCDLQLSALTGPRQITDAWLTALAFRKGGILATLDGSIPWQSVSGATEQPYGAQRDGKHERGGLPAAHGLALDP